MHTYETLFITSPTLTEDDEQATVETMASIVSDGGGEMIANDRMGRRRLAYPIRKFEDGVYTRFLYDSSTDVPKELERRIRLSDKVLRSLTIRREEDWAVAAKEEAVRDAERRVLAEAERVAEAAAAEVAAAEAAAAEAASAAEKAESQTEAEAEESEAAEAPTEAEAVTPEAAEAPTEVTAEAPQESVVEETATDEQTKSDS
jgi:small subunit ribosomal protein S6